MGIDTRGVGHPANSEPGSRMCGDCVDVDRVRDHARGHGLLPSGRQSRLGQGRDNTIIDALAQANDETVATLARLRHRGEDVGRCRLLVFDQDLIEPIERQASQDRDHPAMPNHLRPTGAPPDARHVRDPVLVLPADERGVGRKVRCAARRHASDGEIRWLALNMSVGSYLAFARLSRS